MAFDPSTISRFGCERKTPTYLGQHCRIECAYQNMGGKMGYALKTINQVVAISPDRELLIDLAHHRRMVLDAIAD